MDTNTIKTFLNEVELFYDIDADELDRIASLIKVTTLDPGSLLYEKNSPRRFIFIIHEGEVQLFKLDSFGKEKNLVVFGPGDFIGENVLIDASTYSTFARTMTKTTLLTLDGLYLREHQDEFSIIMLKAI